MTLSANATPLNLIKKHLLASYTVTKWLTKLYVVPGSISKIFCINFLKNTIKHLKHTKK